MLGGDVPDDELRVLAKAGLQRLASPQAKSPSIQCFADFAGFDFDGSVDTDEEGRCSGVG